MRESETQSRHASRVCFRPLVAADFAQRSLKVDSPCLQQSPQAVRPVSCSSIHRHHHPTKSNFSPVLASSRATSRSNASPFPLRLLLPFFGTVLFAAYFHNCRSPFRSASIWDVVRRWEGGDCGCACSEPFGSAWPVSVCRREVKSAVVRGDADGDDEGGSGLEET